MENRQSKDENENLSYILQKKDCMPLKVNGKEIVNSLIGPLKVWNGSDSYVFCLYAITSHNISGNDYNIPKKCFEFGNSVALIKGQEFFERIIQYCKKKNIKVKGELVKYYNIKNYSGDLTPFYKSSNFKHQSEFRIIFDIPDSINNTMKIRLGDISDIVKIFSSSKINSKILITWNI